MLATPNVKAWAQAHFGCPTLPGMPLENQDGTGAGAASHWERTAIYDELMTSTAFGAAKGMTGLTFALLKDTGWYLVDDTFSEKTNYGYQKGCSFVLDACYSTTSFS
jgi:leishmanolysin